MLIVLHELLACPKEFIRLSMRCRRETGSQCELFIALWLNSNHSACVTDREMLSTVIEGIDFPTPFGAHWRDTIKGFSFQKTSSSVLIIWSIISIKPRDLQQSFLQCLYFLFSIGLQICWVKVILTDQKVNSKQQQLQSLVTVVRSRNSHYKKSVTVSFFLLSTHTLHGPLAAN